jgi:hypothetical protein
VGYLPKDCHRIRESVRIASFGGHLLEHAAQLEALAD